MNFFSHTNKFLLSSPPPSSLSPDFNSEHRWRFIMIVFFFFYGNPERCMAPPRPHADSCSSSPYSTTTCLLKCIMSLSAERMTWWNVIYYVNTTMNYVSITVFTQCVQSVKDFFYFSFWSLLFFGPLLPVRWISTIRSPLTGLKLKWKTDKRTQYFSRQTDRLCWTGFQTGSGLSVSDIRLLFDHIQSGEGSRVIKKWGFC